jgi:hypothetical protein
MVKTEELYFLYPAYPETGILSVPVQTGVLIVPVQTGILSVPVQRGSWK